MSISLKTLVPVAVGRISVRKTWLPANLNRFIFGTGKKQSEKNTSIKNGKQPRVSNPNIVLIKQAVIILMLITEKHVKMPARKNSRIEPEVLYPIEKAAKRVRIMHKRPIIN